MTSPLQYLKAHIDNFNVVDFFIFFEYDTEKECRKAFTNLVQYGSNLKRTKQNLKVYNFCRQQEDDEFAVLRSTECQLHFASLRGPEGVRRTGSDDTLVE